MGIELLTSSSSSSFTDAMGEFLQKFDGHPSMQTCFGPGEVRETLSTLTLFLRDRSGGDLAPDASAVLLALRCIKLLTRTRAELDLLLDESNLAPIVRLSSPGAAAVDDELRDPIANEAIRVLINLCIIHQKETLDVLHRQRHGVVVPAPLVSDDPRPRIHLQLVDLLDGVAAVATNAELIFAIARLLFYVCLDDQVQYSLRHDTDGARLVAGKLAQYVDSLDPGSMALRSDAASCAALSELLRVLFALGSDRELIVANQELWQGLTPSLLRLLLGQEFDMTTMTQDELQALPRSAYYLLLLDIVHLFFCFDEQSLRSLLDKDIVRLVLVLLEIQARYNCANVESALVPILTVLRSLCDLHPNVAQDAKEYIFGTEFATNSAMKYGFESGDTTLSSSSQSSPGPQPLCKILRQLITTFNPTVKNAVSQFLFTICGRESNEYIRVVGFGNAVGLLTQLSLPGYQMPSN